MLTLKQQCASPNVKLKAEIKHNFDKKIWASTCTAGLKINLYVMSTLSTVFYGYMFVEYYKNGQFMKFVYILIVVIPED